MPSRLLLVLAAGVALAWAVACSRGAPAASARPAPVTALTASPPAAPPPAAALAPAPPEPKPSAEEIAAIEHPHVAK
jgi:hypothetical protein